MKWEKPKLISLSDWQAHGACSTGSGENDPSPGAHCKVGPSAQGNVCHTGGGAQVNCQNGGIAAPPP